MPQSDTSATITWIPPDEESGRLTYHVSVSQLSNGEVIQERYGLASISWTVTGLSKFHVLMAA